MIIFVIITLIMIIKVTAPKQTVIKMIITFITIPKNRKDTLWLLHNTFSISSPRCTGRVN